MCIICFEAADIFLLNQINRGRQRFPFVLFLPDLLGNAACIAPENVLWWRPDPLDVWRRRNIQRNVKKQSTDKSLRPSCWLIRKWSWTAEAPQTWSFMMFVDSYVLHNFTGANIDVYTNVHVRINVRMCINTCTCMDQHWYIQNVL